jgi:hypothetical protein
MKPLLAITALSLSGGLVILFFCGGQAPSWLLRFECAAFAVGAVAYGCGGFAFPVPEWSASDLVKGVVYVHLGVVTMFIPANIACAALLIGMGMRCIMGEIRSPAATPGGSSRIEGD